MILSDETLKTLIRDKQIVVEPLEEIQIQPASIDMTLGTHFLKVDENEMDSITLEDEIAYVELEKEEIVIPPHSFLLAVTRESIKLPDNITAFVEGRSSVGRMGLFIQNAGWVDPGFEGTITLELYNANRLPIRLKTGRRICQLVFAMMDRSTDAPYNGKYQGQKKATGSRVFQDPER